MFLIHDPIVETQCGIMWDHMIVFRVCMATSWVGQTLLLPFKTYAREKIYPQTIGTCCQCLLLIATSFSALHVSFIHDLGILLKNWAINDYALALVLLEAARLKDTIHEEHCDSGDNLMETALLWIFAALLLHVQQCLIPFWGLHSFSTFFCKVLHTLSDVWYPWIVAKSPNSALHFAILVYPSVVCVQ